MLEKLFGRKLSPGAQETQPFSYPETPYLTAKRLRDMQRSAFNERNWPSIDLEAATLMSSISQNNTEKGSEGPNIKLARRDIDKLVESEIAQIGTDGVEAALKFYNQLTYDGVSSYIGTPKLGYEMIKGYQRWLAKNAPDKSTKKKYSKLVSSQTYSKWGGY